MTDILYVANARIPSRKAHVYQILQMCDAFVEVGNDVELVVPRRRLPDHAPSSADAYYDTPLDFDITRLPCVDFLWLAPYLPDIFAPVLFYIQTVTFTVAALLYAVLTSKEAVYSRARLFTVLVPFFVDVPVVLEAHRYPSREWVARLVGHALDRTAGVVVITQGLREEWQTVTRAQIIVEPDGVQLERFDVSGTKSELRSDLGFPSDARIACYAGSFKPWKGVDTLVRAAAYLPDEFVVCLVGGSDAERERLEADVDAVPQNVRFVGHVAPHVVPRYIAASDVLVLPNSDLRDISSRYTSPLKLFEYMAAERPIVASDLQSLREVLDPEIAFFASPDDPRSFATAITDTIGQTGERRAEAARKRVQLYTWRARADRICDLFEYGDEGGD